MLCCVPKRPAEGHPFLDEGPTRLRSVHEIQVELYSEEDAPSPILLPCAICARTFMPQSLEKHTRICERTAAKKRKPFDSARQRIRGTELAEFLPKQEVARHRQEERGCAVRPSWKKTHDDFLRVIREARGEVMDPQRQCNPLASSSAPTRGNENGTCPTCNRHFGIKAYDRHVAWCKGRITRVSVSPATNLAKERLEARMRYRAPTLKNRRAATREKYSPGSTMNQGNKISSPAFAKQPRESTAVANRESSMKQKPAVVRRPGQLKESPTTSGPAKSRLNAQRTNRQTEVRDLVPISRFAISSRRSLHFPVPPTKPRLNGSVVSNEIPSPVSSRRTSERIESTCRYVGKSSHGDDEGRNREIRCAKAQRNVVSAGSHARNKINDITVNDNVLGVTVQRCTIHRDTQRDDRLVTWKQISRGNPDLRSLGAQRRDRIITNTVAAEIGDHAGQSDPLIVGTNDALNAINGEFQGGDVGRTNERADIAWSGANLNRTYLIKDSEDIERSESIRSKRRAQIKHSPRVQFCLGNTRASGIRGRDKSNLKQPTGTGPYKREGPRKKDPIRMYDAVELESTDELNASEKSPKDKRGAIDRDVDGDTEHSESKETPNCIGHSSRNIAQSAFDSKGNVEPSTLDVVHTTAVDAPRECEYCRDDDRSVSMNESISKQDDKIDLSLHLEDDPAIPDDFHNRAIYHVKSEDEVSQCQSNALLSDPSDGNDATTVNNCAGKSDLGSESPVLSCESKTCNSVDVKENIKVSWTSVFYKTGSHDGSVTKDIGNSLHDVHIEINEGTVESGLIAFQDSEIDLREVNRETPSPRNSEVSADNSLDAHIDDILSQRIDINDKRHREDSFSPDDVENLEDDGRRTDFNVNSDEDSYDKSKLSARSIDGPTIPIRENLRGDMDYTRDEQMDLQLPVTLKDKVKGWCRERSPLRPSMKLGSREISSLTDSDVRECSINLIEMEEKISESMNIFRGSTDSLVSSVEFVELSSIRRPEIDCAYEMESLEIIEPSVRIAGGGLPNIKDEPAVRRFDGCRSLDQTYWERAARISQSKLIGLTSPYYVGYKHNKRNPRIRVLPPVLCASLIARRKIELLTRPAWNNYVRRRPDFNLVLKGRTGKDYDPFLLAEQQMKDLVSDTSDQSVTGSPESRNRDTLYPLSHSSAFVKYPYQTASVQPDKRSSLIAPPSEFDDLASDFSSDSTETNSISREVFLKDLVNSKDRACPKPVKELGRRLIIDKSKALGGDFVEERRDAVDDVEKPSKIVLDKIAPKAKITNRSVATRPNTIRVSSAPKSNSGPDRRVVLGDVRKTKIAEGQRSSDASLNNRNNNHFSLSGSNLSLSSIVSSEMDIKRSNSMFDELMTSFEEEESAFPDLRSFLNNESFDMSSPVHDDRQRNDLISDEELSSPDSFKPRDHGKLSNDSAYSSLNRKYSHHGRSTNDVANRIDENAARNERRYSESSPQATKMSKFCHECGLRFPETAKFCCECGVRRLAL